MRATSGRRLAMTGNYDSSQEFKGWPGRGERKYTTAAGARWNAALPAARVEIGRQILEARVAQQGDHGAAGSEMLGDTKRGDDIGAGRGSGEQGLLPGQSPRHGLRLRSRDRADLVHESRIPERWEKPGSDPFNLMRARTAAGENRGFTGMLAKVSARFNPIAAYYKNRRRAFEMAATGDAEAVFEGMTPLDYVQKGGAWERITPYAGPPVKSGRQR